MKSEKTWREYCEINDRLANEWNLANIVPHTLATGIRIKSTDEYKKKSNRDFIPISRPRIDKAKWFEIVWALNSVCIKYLND